MSAGRSSLRSALGVALALVLVVAASASRADEDPRWKTLAKGLELGIFEAEPPAAVGDSKIYVLRVDPQHYELRLLTVSEYGAPLRSARDWAEQFGLVAVVNAGMFQTDYRSNVGYLRAGAHVNNGHDKKAYKSAAAFGPKRSGDAAFRIFDLDETPMTEVQARYASIVQNLRLIKRPGRNRWSQQDKRWSEVALGEDGAGRILLIFCRSPYSMHDLNAILLALPIDLRCAQHLEGGPEASLLVRAGDFELALMGSFETAFREADDNHHFWPLPNVLGIVPRQTGDTADDGSP